MIALTKTRTNWERLKSAPYLRLKNGKRTSKCQVFSTTVAEKFKSCTELARSYGFFNIHSVSKYQKIKGGPFEDIKKFRKKSQKAETRHKSRNKAQKSKQGTKVYPRTWF